MNLKTKAVFLASLGCIISIAIWFVIGLASDSPLLSDEVCANRGPLIVLHISSAGMFGAVAMGLSTVYSIESWSVLKATLVHFFVTVIMYFGIAFLLGWFDPAKWQVWGIVLIAFILAYAAIWLSHWIAYKREIKKLNSDLKTLFK